MTVIVILIFLIVTLYVGAFLSKRRFGLIGLGLAAGAIISPIWGETAGYVISATGLVSDSMLVNTVALSMLILLPAVLFMFNGHSYKYLVERILGSLLFTILAAAFLIGPIGAAYTFTGPIEGMYSWLVVNKELIIGVGVALAVVDLMIARPVHKSDKKRR
jgi:hypothetical protein